MSTPRQSALFVSAFFDELIGLGVGDVVVSPGSRSTPLAMVAHASSLRLHVAIDERCAAFFALGSAKAGGRPVCLVCTSGTAVANYYPAILEANISRVPLIVLTGDRPPCLQSLGAPQTCDQIKVFGNQVRHFQQMPLPTASAEGIAFARQMALVAFSAAVGSQASIDEQGFPWYGCISNAGPVHLNFPFDEPLKPDLKVAGLFSVGRRKMPFAGTEPFCAGRSTAETLGRAPQSIAGEQGIGGMPLLPNVCTRPDAHTVAAVLEVLRKGRAIVLCGEGSFVGESEAKRLLEWAGHYRLPLLADPLSGLRSYGDPLVIDAYDGLFNALRDALPGTVSGTAPVQSQQSQNGTSLKPDVVIRFGRYPVSKACHTTLGALRPLQIVVDAFETRDFNAATDLFIRTTPAAFVASFPQVADDHAGHGFPSRVQEGFAQLWIDQNKAAAQRTDSPLLRAHDSRLYDAHDSPLSDAHDSRPYDAHDSHLYDAHEGMPSVTGGSKAASNEEAITPSTTSSSPDKPAPVSLKPASVSLEGIAAKGFEGSLVKSLFTLAPAGSCVFSASSMAIRLVDTFYRKQDKPLTVLCNRGLNGIDGTVSSALGAARFFRQTTLLTGDLALLHDIGALALQGEAMRNGNAPSLIIVAMNNRGGKIFEQLPQKSEEPYFERLFLTPHRLELAAIAQGFGIPAVAVATLQEFEAAYQDYRGRPGISLIEARLRPLA
ncbi:MAG: 2-succinyl-5-enolpyruvyl-6-hydroxy-3-cyclohexene-1-carboxylic-acid synthase [Coriobacteriaceae bacterium]|nr:2-succinyl-5-enolpyruvyl-6-hydroxy-3-cyclohexene-1-carboxylic-acid synthase [Coriobacteriaceae bacterium]